MGFINSIIVAVIAGLISTIIYTLLDKLIFSKISIYSSLRTKIFSILNFHYHCTEKLCDGKNKDNIEKYEEAAKDFRQLALEIRSIILQNNFFPSKTSKLKEVSELIMKLSKSLYSVDGIEDSKQVKENQKDINKIFELLNLNKFGNI